MRNIILIGLNHKTAPVALRECLAFDGDDSEQAIRELHDLPEISEVMLLSTCNRVEVVLSAEDPEAAVHSVKQFLLDSRDVPQDQIDEAVYVHHNDEAIRHLFRVASSLDSMVVGEPQILGQVKTAYHEATRCSTSGVILNRLLHRTFFVAKRVRSETGIGDHAVSISYAAIELARKIFGDLTGKKVLLIGAGEMAELAVEHLIRHHAGDIYVANRTFERGVDLADRFQGTAIRFEEIVSTLSEVDIVISSTGAPEYVVTRPEVKSVMKRRRNRPVFFIDIAVPRDIDPEINRINNIYVYDIDDLNGIVDENIEDRRKEAVKGERIIDEAVIKFHQWMDSLDVVPTIKELRQKITDIVQSEIDRTLNGTELSDAERAAVGRMIPSLVNKILHHPTALLKGSGCHGDQAIYLDITRKLFKLDNG